MKGIPDIIGCVNGQYVALEVKRSESEANKQTGRTVLQRHTINKIRKVGGYATFIYPLNAGEVLADLTDFL